MQFLPAIGELRIDLQMEIRVGMLYLLLVVQLGFLLPCVQQHRIRSCHLVNLDMRV